MQFEFPFFETIASSQEIKKSHGKNQNQINRKK